MLATLVPGLLADVDTSGTGDFRDIPFVTGLLVMVGRPVAMLVAFAAGGFTVFLAMPAAVGPDVRARKQAFVALGLVSLAVGLAVWWRFAAYGVSP